MTYTLIGFTSFAGESGDIFPEGYGVESRASLRYPLHRQVVSKE